MFQRYFFSFSAFLPRICAQVCRSIAGNKTAGVKPAVLFAQFDI